MELELKYLILVVLEIHFFFYLLQLIEDENVQAVISMNEDYELFFANNYKVCRF